MRPWVAYVDARLRVLPAPKRLGFFVNDEFSQQNKQNTFFTSVLDLSKLLGGPAQAGLRSVPDLTSGMVQEVCPARHRRCHAPGITVVAALHMHGLTDRP